MSETGWGWLGLVLLLVGALMIRRSLKTGESVTPWPMGSVTRSNHPVLFWFDLVTYTAMTLLGMIASFQLIR